MNIAIYRDGKQLYAHSYGVANLELSQANDARRVYPIGSVSKQFVGYCIQLLAHQGKLSVTNDVRRSDGAWLRRQPGELPTLKARSVEEYQNRRSGPHPRSLHVQC